ncbi:hypothetical protein D1P53_003812 [Cryptococcus gattii VGV]|nr:hypothetical protein D1P53_003812 [Cryptococcus gattii VGV]
MTSLGEENIMAELTRALQENEALKAEMIRKDKWAEDLVQQLEILGGNSEEDKFISHHTTTYTMSPMSHTPACQSLAAQNPNMAHRMMTATLTAENRSLTVSSSPSPATPASSTYVLPSAPEIMQPVSQPIREIIESPEEAGPLLLMAMAN